MVVAGVEDWEDDATDEDSLGILVDSERAAVGLIELVCVNVVD